MSRIVAVLILAGLSATLVCSPRASAGEKLQIRPQTIVQEITKPLAIGVHEVKISGSAYEIHFVNGYKSEIEVAIFVVDAGEWKTKGWWPIKPGKSEFVARTKTSSFCYYARTLDGRAVWDGKIHPEKKYEYTVRDSMEVFAFRKLEMNPERYVRFTATLCE